MLADVTLSLGDYGVIAGIVGIIVAVPAAMLGFWMRGNCQEHEAIREDVKALHQRADKLETMKVDKLDWLRETVTTRKKMDRLLEQQAELKGAVDAQLGMTAGLARLSLAIEQHQVREAR